MQHTSLDGVLPGIGDAGVFVGGDGSIGPAPVPPPPMQMIQMISGFWISRAVFVAARLGLADLVEEAPRTADDLAQTTGTNPQALYRLLRALASAGVFTEGEDGRFAQTPLSGTLRSDVPGSLRAFVITELGLDHFQAWEHLLYSVSTGKTAFDHRFGMPVWEYYTRRPEYGRLFAESTTNTTGAIVGGVMEAYDFSSFSTVVDVGGGNGHLLAAVLKANPEAQGILYDLPSVTPGAHRLLDADGLEDRALVVPGDFFTSVPAGGDAYLLKWILHDWDDERAVTILKNCRRAMGTSGKILVIEAVIQPRNVPELGKWIDLNMLVMTGGRERTEAEFRAVFEAAGFRLNQVVPTDFGMNVIEGVPA